MNRKRVQLACGLAAMAMTMTMAIVVPGCSGPPEGGGSTIKALVMDNPEAIAACLPPGVTFESRVTDTEGGATDTVKDELTRMQARPKGKTLLDASGREIAFHKSALKGREVARDKEYLKLRKSRTVVLLAP